MVDVVECMLGTLPKQFLANAGYRSEAALEALAKKRCEVISVLGREGRKHEGIDAQKHPRTAQMTAKLQRDEGKAAYLRRERPQPGGRRAVRPSGRQAVRPSGRQAVRPSGRQAVRPSGGAFEENRKRSTALPRHHCTAPNASCARQRHGISSARRILAKAVDLRAVRPTWKNRTHCVRNHQFSDSVSLQRRGDVFGYGHRSR